jgi:flagellar biogenesis protein FliO
MDMARPVTAVVFVLALLGAVLWAVRRAARSLPRPLSSRWRIPARTRKLEAIERVALTPQHALHLVRFGDRELVVSTHPQGCSVLVSHASACSVGTPADVSPELTGASA